MIRHEYAQSHKSTNSPSTNIPKSRRYRNPESWAKGLILLHWEFVIKLWEHRIKAVPCMPLGTIPTDTYSFELQKAIRALHTHTITNHNDRKLIIRSETELAGFSLNQLKLWTSNVQLLNQINSTELVMGTCEPIPNSPTLPRISNPTTNS